MNDRLNEADEKDQAAEAHDGTTRGQSEEGQGFHGAGRIYRIGVTGLRGSPCGPRLHPTGETTCLKLGQVGAAPCPTPAPSEIATAQPLRGTGGGPIDWPATKRGINRSCMTVGDWWWASRASMTASLRAMAEASEL